ncbi:MAG: hypothetical protein K2I00_09650 [Ruminococcus sp.]|nr:hypothetical protein [Ruminococcus sp.]
MTIKKITAVLASVCCMLCLASCGDKSKSESSSDSGTNQSDGNTSNQNGVGDVVSPEEDSDEFDLGEYRVSDTGIKLYYDDSDIPTELMHTLENYFMTFQNDDFEGYKNILYPNYAERYNEYLVNEYSASLENGEKYDLKNSFNSACNSIRTNMMYELSNTQDGETYTGDFTITRIRAERPELDEGETIEDRKKEFFSYLDEIFDMDYYQTVSDDMENLEYVTFYIIAEGEDGEEHKILNDMGILFGLKDGVYYTFG